MSKMESEKQHFYSGQIWSQIVQEVKTWTGTGRGSWLLESCRVSRCEKHFNSRDYSSSVVFFSSFYFFAPLFKTHFHDLGSERSRFVTPFSCFFFPSADSNCVFFSHQWKSSNNNLEEMRCFFPLDVNCFVVDLQRSFTHCHLQYSFDPCGASHVTGVYVSLSQCPKFISAQRVLGAWLRLEKKENPARDSITT